MTSKEAILFLCKIRKEAIEVHLSADSQFYVGFAKAKVTKSIIRYSGLSTITKVIDNELAPLKQKYKDFALTWFWEFKTKNAYALHLQLNGFMMKYSGISCIIRQQYQEEYLNIKIKISGKISHVFYIVQ